MIHEAARYMLRMEERIVPWQVHSLATAVLAALIADAVPGCDRERAVAGALLHDVGRSINCGLYHSLAGYLMLFGSIRLKRYARFCITHWLKGRRRDEVLREGGLEPGFVDFIMGLEDFVNLSVEDLIVNVADSMARRNVVVDISARYEDAMRRYGDTPWIRGNRDRSLAFKVRLDELAGCDIYGVLPPFGCSIDVETAFKELGLEGVL